MVVSVAADPMDNAGCPLPQPGIPEDTGDGDSVPQPLLTVPYPLEAASADLLAAGHPAGRDCRLGLFAVGRPRCYAYWANKSAILDATKQLGFRKRDLGVQAASNGEEEKESEEKPAEAEEEAAEAEGEVAEAEEKAVEAEEKAVEAQEKLAEAEEKMVEAVEEAMAEEEEKAAEEEEKAAEAKEGVAEVEEASMAEKEEEVAEAEQTTNEAKKAAAELTAQQLASDLRAESPSRMNLVFLKPRQLPWNCLGNSLLFEPNHQSSLFASDKWQMARILRTRARQSQLLRGLCDASGGAFGPDRFCLYTANAGKRGQAQLLKYLDENPGVYVLKRTNSSQGVGIYMYTAKDGVANTPERLQSCAGAKARLGRYVVQKYIERPLLVDKRKFDLRAYLLVLCCASPNRPGKRGYFAFSHPGYVKLSVRPYAETSRDPRVHFTNQWVQRRHRRRQYDSVKEATTWLPDELDAYLERRGRVPSGWCRERLYPQVAAITGYLAAACRPYLESRGRPGCVFRIYGPDLIVDEALRVHLLEFNCFPCFAKNTVALSACLNAMWREAICVATEASLRYRAGQPVSAPLTGRSFRLVYSSEDANVLRELVRAGYS